MNLKSQETIPSRSKLLQIGKKATFSNLFIILAVMLILLPFLNSLQNFLTNVIMKIGVYKALQTYVVPYELRVLSTILDFLNLQTRAGKAYIEFVKDGKLQVVFLEWNCIGWQSFIFLIISLTGGLTGKYTWLSKTQVLLMGVLGTYLVNMLRLVIIIVVYYFTSKGFGVVFHNYFSNLMAIFWLFIFWWIAYSFVLVEKEETEHKQTVSLKKGEVLD